MNHLQIDWLQFKGDYYFQQKQYYKALDQYCKAQSKINQNYISVKQTIIQLKRAQIKYELAQYQQAQNLLKQVSFFFSIIGYKNQQHIRNCFLQYYTIIFQSQRVFSEQGFKQVQITLSYILKMQQRLFGNQSIQSITTLKLLCRLYIKIGKLDQLILTFIKIFNILKLKQNTRWIQFIPIVYQLKKLGIKNAQYEKVQTIKYYIFLFKLISRSILNNKRKQQTLSLLQKVLESKIYPKFIFFVFNSYKFLKLTSRLQKQKNKSFQERFNQFINSLNPIQPLKPQLFHYLNIYFMSLEQFQESISISNYKQIFFNYNKIFVQKTPQFQLQYFHHLANKFQIQGRYFKAIQYLQKSLQVAKKNVIKYSSEISGILLQLSSIYKVLKNNKKMNYYLNQASAYMSNAPSFLPKHSENLMFLAQENVNKKNLKTALKYFDKSYKTIQKIYDKDQQDEDISHLSQKQKLNFQYLSQLNLLFQQDNQQILSKNLSKMNMSIQNQFQNYQCIYDIIYNFENAKTKQSNLQYPRWLVIFQYSEVIQDLEITSYQRLSIIIKMEATERLNNLFLSQLSKLI